MRFESHAEIRKMRVQPGLRPDPLGELTTLTQLDLWRERSGEKKGNVEVLVRLGGRLLPAADYCMSPAVLPVFMTLDF